MSKVFDFTNVQEMKVTVSRSELFPVYWLALVVAYAVGMMNIIIWRQSFDSGVLLALGVAYAACGYFLYAGICRHQAELLRHKAALMQRPVVDLWVQDMPHLLLHGQNAYPLLREVLTDSFFGVIRAFEKEGQELRAFGIGVYPVFSPDFAAWAVTERHQLAYAYHFKLYERLQDEARQVLSMREYVAESVKRPQ